MDILGISAFYHDSAAALIRDGDIIAAAQEERFTRVKHDHRFPVQAIQYCLQEGGIQADQLDYIGFYDKPIVKFERILDIKPIINYIFKVDNWGSLPFKHAQILKKEGYDGASINIDPISYTIN